MSRFPWTSGDFDCVFGDIEAEMQSAEDKYGPIDTYGRELDIIPMVRDDKLYDSAVLMGYFARSEMTSVETHSVFAILGEEVGELARALRDGTDQEAYKEAIQVGAVAFRMALLIRARRVL